MLPDAKFVHPDFSEEKTETYQLICSIAEHQFTFLVTNRTQDILMLQRFVNRDLLPVRELTEAVLEKESFLKKDFAYKQILLHSSRWMLLPEMAYLKGADEDLLLMAHEVSESEDDFIVDAIAPLSVRALYATNKDLLEFFRKQFPQVQFRHVISQVIRQTHRIMNQANAEVLGLIEFIDFEMVYVIFRDGEPLFGNVFRVKNADEAFEYLKKVNIAYGLGPNDMKIGLVGIGPLVAGMQDKLSSFSENFISSRDYYNRQEELNNAGIYMDDYSHLQIPFG